MINFVCVLKSGGDYELEHVWNIKNMLDKHVPETHRLILLTDLLAYEVHAVSSCVFVIPLIHNLPKWWSKLELFRLTGACIYFDLDTVITGEINRLTESVSGEEHKFIMLNSFKRKRFMSGVMAWNGDYSFILNDLLKKKTSGTFKQRTALSGPSAIIDNRSFVGDQEWIAHSLRMNKESVTPLQKIQRGVCSYKHHLMNAKELPENTSIVCFHGSPRPHELIDGHFLKECYAG